MNEQEYLDRGGVAKLWSKIKSYVQKYVQENKPVLSWDNITGKPDFSSVYRYKGTVALVSELPSEGNEIGDVWDVQHNDMNYGWTGDHWDPLGQIFTISSIPDSVIDEITAEE